MSDDLDAGSRAGLAKVIPRRPAVSWWLGIVLALGFATLVTPVITAEHWMLRFGPWSIVEHREAPFTVRAPMTGAGELRVGGGVVVARGEIATRDEATLADAIAGTTPGGTGLYLAMFALSFVLGALFTHHISRSTKGRLVRVQVVNLATIAVIAVAVKIVLLSTALSALVVPLAVLAMVPTMVLDRVVGLATGVLAALVVSLQAPFDIGLALLLLVQTAAAGLVIAERPRRRWLAALTAGAVTTLCTGATYLLLTYLISGRAPDLHDPLHSPWLAAAVGPAIAALLAVPVLPLYQLLVGEITRGKLIALEDLGHPLLRQIAEKSPGTWQHSLMMANMAEIAANAIGANGRLVRVGAYFHDLGKSLQPKYFIENLEAGETSPHDLLPPEVSCDAIFAHVTEGIVTARRARLHERIIDFMHMHHGNGVLEYFWAKCREQGNPDGLTVEDFRYPGHPPQSRETALLAICDAVEAASRTLHKPDPAAIDSLVQRIVYGKLHLGQLDDSGLSMGDLRRISDSLRETIRHANHGRIEYPWQKAGQDASASVMATSTTAPRLDSLDRKPARDTARRAARPGDSDSALAVTADVKDSGPTRSDGDAARIRAGTARNAQPGDRWPAPESATVDPAFEPTLDDPGAAHTQLPRADASASEPGRRALPLPAPPEPGDASGDTVARIVDRPPSQVQPTTLPGRAPGPRWGEEVNVASAGTAPPGRDPMTTLQGRAPGPTPAPPDARAASDHAPSPAEPGAAAAGDVSSGRAVERSPIAGRPPSGRDPMTTLQGRAPGPTPAAADRALSAPAPEDGPARSASASPTASALAAAQRASASAGAMRNAQGSVPPATWPAPDASPFSEPTRRGGPPAPVEPDAALTNPPMRRAATEQPDERHEAMEGAPRGSIDPAQVAAALESLVRRVAHAPFGKPDGAPGAQLDAAVTQPSVPRLDPSDLDAAVTQPGLAAASAAAARDPESVVTRPALPRGSAPLAQPGADGSTRHPPPAAARAKTASPLRTSGLAAAGSGPLPPQRVGDDAITMRRTPGDPATAPDDDARVTQPRAPTVPPASAAHALAQIRDPDAGATEPSLPVLAIGDQRRVDVPLAPGAAADAEARGKTGWAAGLAARVDAALDSDTWGKETPVAGPSSAELRMLLGQADPTRQQPVEDIEQLQRRAAELGDPPRRSPNPTAEVDPDDIEAAIEVAPPARRQVHPNAIGAVKPRKPE
jgi:putative nucleotidyltransferase with HDIG domain